MSRPSKTTSSHRPSPDQLKAIAHFFNVLSDPTRLAILNHLREGDATVSQVMEALDLKQANASKQLGILYRADLLTRHPDGSQVRYAIGSPVIFELCDLVCDKIGQDVARKHQAFGGGTR